MCGLEVQVRGPEIVSIRGHREDPLSRGHICPKGVAIADVQADPDRLRVPVRRVGSGADADTAVFGNTDDDAEAADEAPAPGIDLWTEARLPHAPQSAAAFLEEQAQSRLAAPASRAITAPAHAAPAHPLRGLQYAQPDSVYTYLLSAPVQGRAVMRVEDSRRSRYFMGSDAALAVASGGHVGHLPLQHRHGLDVVDYTRAKPARGAGHFRVLHAWLDRHAVPTPPRRTPPGVHASEPELGYVRTQMMALRRPVHDAPLPGSPRWIDEPEDARVLRASSPEAGSLFGAIARSGRAAPQPRSHAKRQRLQKRKRDAPSSTNKDVQMLDNIKNLLAPQ